MYLQATGSEGSLQIERTLCQTLTLVKTTVPEMKKKDVIYEVPCMDYDKSYISGTGRNLQKRLT